MTQAHPLLLIIFYTEISYRINPPPIHVKKNREQRFGSNATQAPPNRRNSPEAGERS